MDRSDKGLGRALLSVHDVTPSSLGLLTGWLPILREAGVPAVNIAVVPLFRGADTWGDGKALGQALAAAGPSLRTEVLQHGFFHARQGENAELGRLRGLLSRLQSAGEDEFFGLGADASEERVRSGCDIIAAALGRRPRAFIPPAWAGSSALRSVLRKSGFTATEDHLWIYDLGTGRRLLSPVIAFATRDLRRERLSTVWARLVSGNIGPRTILRFAVHPSDLRSPRIRDFLLTILARIAPTCEWRLYEDLFGSARERR